jgi:hypothetical protein
MSSLKAVDSLWMVRVFNEILHVACIVRKVESLLWLQRTGNLDTWTLFLINSVKLDAS